MKGEKESNKMVQQRNKKKQKARKCVKIQKRHKKKTKSLKHRDNQKVR